MFDFEDYIDNKKMAMYYLYKHSALVEMAGQSIQYSSEYFPIH